MTSKLSPFQISLGRRALLKSLGFATAGALTGTAWERAQAATKPPTRIIFFYTDNGTLQSSWRPGPPAGQSMATEDAWELGELHAPILKDHKKDLIYIENVDLISTDLDLSKGSGSHERMQTHLLNGANRAGVNRGGAMTIDQYIAKTINAPQAVTSFPSLEYCFTHNNHHCLSWSGPGQFVDPEYEPLKGYDRLVKLIVPTKTDDAAVQAAARAAARRKAIFDTLRGDFASLQTGLSSHSKAKIDAHASTLRDLESRLGVVGNSATCQAPSRAVPLAVDQLQKSGNTQVREFWDQGSDAFMHMATAALACDLTRVVTLEYGNPPSSITGTKGDIHLDHVHGTVNEQSLEHLRTMEGYEVMMKYHRWYAQQFAKLIAMLKAIPEGEPGQTLFDHTVIYWFTPMGQGNHEAHRIPYVLAGSAGGYFRTNRYIKFDRRQATPEEKRLDSKEFDDQDKADTPPTRGQPHNGLLVSLVNAMGIPIEQYGNPAIPKGPLPRLRPA